MKVAIRLILFLSVVSYLVYAVVTFSKPAESLICEGVEVQITDSTLYDFLSEDYIMELLRKHNVYPAGQEISHVNIAQIEEFLKADPYIGNAKCYHSAAKRLCIQVVPLRPILHMMTQSGEDYYLDSKGAAMPVGNINVDLCIATGRISRDFAKNKLMGLAAYIYENDFWNKQIEQIHVTADGTVELFPRVGEHTIVLGSTDNYKEKLGKLYAFYRNGLPRIGWNKYSIINLAYNGQIVCTKRENKKH